MTIARTLADFVQSTRSIPASTRSIVRNAILDLVTAAILGHHSQGSRVARLAAETAWGKGAARCWFSDSRLTVPGAAFVNSALASLLDLDDGHRAAAGHPGASIIPAVFATAETLEASSEELETAIALGYEVAIRIAAARDLSNVDTLVSGRWCGQGAAAAAAWLRGLSPDQTMQALALAGSSAPNLTAVAYSQVMGNHLKEGIPWATATGLTAVDLAAQGFTGPIDLFDNEQIFDGQTLSAELGHKWHIENIYFKPYSCCRWAHAAIDALLALQKEAHFSVEDIQAIEVKTFSRALQLNNEAAPKTLESAQYSVPFCLALAAARGPSALLPLQEVSLQDDEVTVLARKVKMMIDPQLDAMFSAAVPARLTIQTAHGNLSKSVMAPKGEPCNPMTWEDLVAKLKRATEPVVGLHFSARAVEALSSFSKGDSRPLQELLQWSGHLEIAD